MSPSNRKPMADAIGVPPTSDSSMVRRVWRWHFYAGLVCLPFVFLLAITGALYLFRFEIEDLVYRDVLIVPLQTATLNPQRIVDAALRAHPGRVSRYTPPAAADRSAEVDLLRSGDDAEIQVFVNPGSGQVLGSVAASMRLMPLVRQLHSLALFGGWAQHLIEVVAGWVIVLVVTGTYLWWPRGRSGGVLSVRLTPSTRVWWRDLHAVSGALAGGVILFLALTGLPWSIFWGKGFNQFITDHGWGVPAGVWGAVPQSHGAHQPMAGLGEIPWTLREQSLPQSAHDVTMSMPSTPIGIDAAVSALARLGMHGGYALSMPQGPSGVYTAMRFPDAVSAQRVVHLDQYTGRALIDVGYAQYGAISKVTEWGVSVHMGREFGRANQILMLSGCIALIVMTVSAAMMWWKRRPRGRLAAPPRKDADRIARSAIAIAALLGIAFPLLGASMLIAATLDWLVPLAWRSRWAL